MQLIALCEKTEKLVRLIIEHRRNWRIMLWRNYHLTLGRVFSSNAKVECPLCGWRGDSFMDYQAGFRHVYPHSTCPICFSHPRHRTLFFYLNDLLQKRQRGKLLHVAPEDSIKKVIHRYPQIDYLSVDIKKQRALRQEDITNLTFADYSFDFILCFHVLEHVTDDAKAIRELYRVLKSGGIAIIDVPIDFSRESTLEDPSIVTAEERTKRYMQWDHLRLYGLDFPDRLRRAGFSVSQEYFARRLGEDKIARYGLEDIPIYVCRK